MLSIFRSLITTAILSVLLLASLGCSGMAYKYLDSRYRSTIEISEGEHRLNGLKKPVIVRRDNLGIPYIKAESVDDLVYAAGYTAAMDRLSQMIEFRLAAQGRLAEMSGRTGLKLDLFLRALNIRKGAEIMLESTSDHIKYLLERYSDGVNAYMEEHKERLPVNIDITGYKPEKWTPHDSVTVFVFLTLGLAQNLHEELDILNMVSKVGVDNMAWLIPVYPDEPLPFSEMEKLNELDFTGNKEDLNDLFATVQKASELNMLQTVASNNWVVSGKRTENGKSILANDTHLPLSMPSIWHMVNLESPEYRGAGISLAGLPGIIAGYNGHVAWGMTMVMDDNQDLFIEKLKKIDGRLHYLYKGEWLKASERKEIFKIKGKKPVTKIIYETKHGPLLNGLLNSEPMNEIAPQPSDHPFGFALSWAAFEPDRSMDAFLEIAKAKDMNQAVETMKGITAIPLNMVVADSDNIAWVVTGRFPLRKKGSGLVPSPGWIGDYDWTGFLDIDEYPREINHERGYSQSANNRTVPADFPHTLSSGWYYPERSERIIEMIEEAKPYSIETAKAMQLDTKTLSAGKFQKTIFEKATLYEINQEINSWQKSKKRENALEGLKILKNFDGNMSVDSKGAAVFAAFSTHLMQNIFLDELGPEENISWKSFLDTHLLSYSAFQDHMTIRCKESPFWDNTETDKKETRGIIIAKSLADAIGFLEDEIGKNRKNWKWGSLHKAHWAIEASKMAHHLGFFERNGMKFLGNYFNRGPFPVPGDHNTLNVAAYHQAKDYNVWLIPEMRIIVDFSRDEPMIGINSSGQSGNPVSPHYADGIYKFLEGSYHPFPLKPENIEKQYDRLLMLMPE